MHQIAGEPLVVLNRPVAAGYYRGLFDTHARRAPIAYAYSTEMVRSLVGEGIGCAILNMRPLTAVSYGGADLVARLISDPLPPLTLAIAYNKSRPRRLVQRFAHACQAHFAAPGAEQCIVA